MLFDVSGIELGRAVGRVVQVREGIAGSRLGLLGLGWLLYRLGLLILLLRSRRRLGRCFLSRSDCRHRCAAGRTEFNSVVYLLSTFSTECHNYFLL